MARISLSPQFLKEVFNLFKGRSLKELIFGKRVQLNQSEQELLAWIRANPGQFLSLKGRSGTFIKKDIVHKGSGTVYLLPNTLKDPQKQSILLFDEATVITPGPDLWVYLSSEPDVSRGLGEFLNLGLLKGTKGGQSYTIDQPAGALDHYRSVVIWCKQFSVLFTFAALQ